MRPRIDVARAAAAAAPAITAVIDEARALPGFGSDIPTTLGWARRAARAAGAASAPEAEAWQLLASTAAVDVGAARILEPHVDALRILAEAGRDGCGLPSDALGVDDRSAWGVFAAERHGDRLSARQTRDGWLLTGRKPWCSLARDLSHALVTAWAADDRRGLFAVRLDEPGVRAHEGPWHARGLAQVVSAPVDFERVPAAPVGGPGWYLGRRGFPIGGIGVAAAWWGGASGLLPALSAAARAPDADQLAQAHAGAADAALWAARSVLREAQGLVADAGSAALRTLAARVRAIVAQAVEEVVRIAGHALGAAPLAADEGHARRVADLQLYLRQHHAERDLARLGRDVARGAAPW